MLSCGSWCARSNLDLFFVYTLLLQTFVGEDYNDDRDIPGMVPGTQKGYMVISVVGVYKKGRYFLTHLLQQRTTSPQMTRPCAYNGLTHALLAVVCHSS